MKKLLMIVIIVLGSPKFSGMIIRQMKGTDKYRWECEFGVETATATVNDNLILESIGCADAPKVTTELKITPLDLGSTVYIQPN